MTSSLLAAELHQYRPTLTGHCYRMLGSIADADDAVQETYVRAIRGLDQFEARSSPKTWLHRIATRVCLDALDHRKRRRLPIDSGPVGSVESRLTTEPRTHWLEPVPDATVLPREAEPTEIASLRQSVRLAFVSALQRLPPRQRAVLLLKDVLGFSSKEIAETLEVSPAAVNSALQRARETLRPPEAEAPSPSDVAPELSPNQEALLARYVDTFHAYDVEGLVALLREDATMSMPPYALWLRGPEDIAAWFLGPGKGCRGSRLVATQASGAPAFAQYRVDPGGGYKAWSLVVLDLKGDRIADMVHFLDVETLFPRFSLPLRIKSELGPSGPSSSGR
ncbi:MAG: sigma-70 family RNA polymerase sigma factor [Myxococcota bacterium]